MAAFLKGGRNVTNPPSRAFSAKGGRSHKRRQCGGCLVLYGDPVDPHVVCTNLRWTRNGMKTLMHMLNGADRWNGQRIVNAVRNCTAFELKFLTSGVQKLWHDPLLPWCPTGALQNATNLYPQLFYSCPGRN